MKRNYMKEFFKLFGVEDENSFQERIIFAISAFSNSDVTFMIKRFHELENRIYIDYEPLDRWVASNFTDFSVYAHPEFKLDILNSSTWACKNSIQNLAKKIMNDYNDINSVVDYAAGIGITTIMLANMLKEHNKTVYYFDPYNNSFFKWMLEKFKIDLPNLIVAEKEEDIHADCIVTLEFLEHLKDPIEFVKNNKPNYKYWAFTNAFSAIHVGHFPSYLFEGKEIQGKSFVRKFNKFMKSEYDFLFSGWNGKPIFWKRKEIL